MLRFRTNKNKYLNYITQRERAEFGKGFMYATLISSVFWIGLFILLR